MERSDGVSNQDRKYPLYKAPEEEIDERIREFIAFLKFKYLKGRPNAIDSYSVDLDTLAEVFIRVDQRKIHYRIYHGIEINELKRAATLCYWLMKLRPIVKLKREFDGSGHIVKAGHVDNRVCEKLCIFMLAGAVNEYRARRNKPKVELFSSTGDSGGEREMSLFQDIEYFFRHRLATPDSIIALAEGMAKS
jgi:hypothetical protein